MLVAEAGLDMNWTGSWKCRSLMTPYLIKIWLHHRRYGPPVGALAGRALSSFPTPSFGLALGFDNLNSNIELEEMY